MADIKQAAKWMQEGKCVRRPQFFGDFAYMAARKMNGAISNSIVVTDGDEEDEPFSLSDLLADDWEVANV